MFLFAGVTGKAIEALPHEEEKEILNKKVPIINEPQSRIRSAELEQEFVGTNQSLNMSFGSEKVSVFQGVSTRVYHNLEENDLETIGSNGLEMYKKAQVVSAHQTRKESSDSTVISNRTKNSIRVDVFSKDGSILRIEVQE
jgi:carotenoid cleavage dioxygenase-like enzyme